MVAPTRNRGMQLYNIGFRRKAAHCTLAADSHSIHGMKHFWSDFGPQRLDSPLEVEIILEMLNDKTFTLKKKHFYLCVEWSALEFFFVNVHHEKNLLDNIGYKKTLYSKLWSYCGDGKIPAL